jgi:chromate transporter
MGDSETIKAWSLSPKTRQTSLRELAFLFLKLGTIAFGGPAAHIALMEAEVVRERRWLTREEFLDLWGATNLIPGPNSTELAIHIGHRRAGWLGLCVAGACFIFPASLLVTACAWTYVRFGSLPEMVGVLYRVKPAVIAVILLALWGLGQSAIKTKFLAVVTGTGIIMNFLGIHELAVLFGCGLGTVCWKWIGSKGRFRTVPAFFTGTPFVLSSASGASGALVTGASFSLWAMFLFFVKIGSVLFGSGYVLLAFLRGDLVERWHWLSETQLLDAIAIGQVTPGPVFTTATFIGYILGGSTGAALATLGIFLPAFIFVGASGSLIPRMRKSQTAGAFLDGVNAASLALMAVVTWHLSEVTLTDLTNVVLLAVSLILLVRFRINSVWLILAAVLVGLLIRS